MDYSLNAVSEYLFKLTFVIEIYLIFTNVSYVILNRKYCVPLLQQNDPKLNHYRRVAYLSRTLYLVCITMWNSVEFTPDIWKDMMGTSCQGLNIYFSLIPIIYLYISVLCRAVFSWTRSVLTKYSINLSYIWDIIVFGFNMCFSLAFFIWYLIQFKRNSFHDCLPVLEKDGVIICAVCYALWEILSFLLFYIPLKEAYRVFGSSTDEYGKAFLTANQQLDDMETGQDETEDDHRSVLHSDGSFTSSAQMSQNCLGLVTQFRKSVKRNLLAGVLIIVIAHFQCAVYIILYHGDIISVDVIISGEKMNFQDVFVRLIIVIFGLMQYVCMMLTESNWQRAFIPFWCWQRKSWTNLRSYE